MLGPNALAAIGLLVVASCTGAPTSSAPAASTPSASMIEASPNASPEASVLGAYTATLNDFEAPEGAECAREGGCLPPTGEWAIELTETSLSITPALGNYPSQPVTDLSDPNADEGTIRLGRSPLPCLLTTGPEGEGQYSWTRDGDVLTFSLIQDDCADRMLILTTVPWTRE